MNIILINNAIQYCIISCTIMEELFVGDRVEIRNFGQYIGNGTIIQLWEGSLEEKLSKYYGLPKYKVKYDNGSILWRYNTDLKKINYFFQI